MRVMFLPG